MNAAVGKLATLSQNPHGNEVRGKRNANRGEAVKRQIESLGVIFC
jgi:hypothetical protein